MGNNLKELRVKAGLGQAELAEKMGTTRNQLAKLESGTRRLSDVWIARAAFALDVDPGELVTDAAQRDVPLVGYVSAGAVAVFFSDGQGPFDEVEAPEDATASTVAVEVRGDSLGPIFNQWLVFYDDVRERPRSQWIGQLCVIGCADNRVVVKQLSRGQLPGTYTLLSNSGPPMYDVEIDWAAPVTSMRPR